MAAIGYGCDRLAFPFAATAAVGSAFPFVVIVAVGQLVLLVIAIRVNRYPMKLSRYDFINEKFVRT